MKSVGRNIFLLISRKIISIKPAPKLIVSGTKVPHELLFCGAKG
jgi:hypothetical protein